MRSTSCRWTFSPAFFFGKLVAEVDVSDISGFTAFQRELFVVTHATENFSVVYFWVPENISKASI